MITLNPTALATLAAYDVTTEQWIAERGYEGRWTGDTCGCPDDRCIGHHHDENEECECLRVLLDQYVADRYHPGDTRDCPLCTEPTAHHTKPGECPPPL